ncbi:hypothetical protein CANTEDRAFT_98617 [Yamadazyma tenuis ATCC 10573]|uniref:Endoplasmic reticulum junction formation protein lunapark n=1 Tax=Candida tenuis (strain ATCC 10573 / BCRC 21748 / CBS 615 / JCM 9827 / NBRC 10315 / NRRL Y-1498 / VKM Y-70) TaxID=590646 RepID=G3BA02_CANTC|nr:uncharacterized protein CANTEDRAFT_98617 [Yamadazyma tenuis ATCC 10573]EGV61366.1 hypothetical protein CANTEDRAFT_98617 [Yamadazyma tenuis ATCC 10573]
MGVFKLFSSGKLDIEGFEKELSDINVAINKNHQEMLKLNDLKKRIVYSIAYYFSIFYVLVMSVLIVKMPANSGHVNYLKWFLTNQSRSQLLVIGGIPGVGFLLAYILRKLITLMISSRSNKARKLKRKQKAKIDELKKLTNYNTTNQLLTKYDSPKKNSTPEVKSAVPANTAAKAATGKLPPTKHQESGNTNPTFQQAPPGPSKRTIQDRILDILVGSEDESIENRYALICKKCFNHCGLAPPSTKDPATVTFVCPYCKFLNGDEPKESISPVKEDQQADISPVKKDQEPEISPVNEGPEAESSQPHT